MSFLEYQRHNPEFLNNYLKYHRYISFGATTTVNEEYFDLRTFFRYIKLKRSAEINIDNITIDKFKEIEIRDITLEEIGRVKRNTITDFLCFLNHTLNNCAKTRNRKLNSLKRFFEYLETNNLIAHNPTLGVKCATVEKRQPKYLNLTESKQLLSKTITSTQRYKIRNYAITCIFLNCSIRLSELVGIDLTDFKLDEQTLKIKGKGNIERMIYLNDAASEAITEYLKVRPELTIDNPDYNALFISSQNKRISQRSVQTLITQEISLAFKQAKNDLHTHSLRHTSATLLYIENNVDIFTIKAILGHKSVASTGIYTHISSEKMKEVMQKYTISSILERMEEIDNGKS